MKNLQEAKDLTVFVINSDNEPEEMNYYEFIMGYRDWSPSRRRGVPMIYKDKLFLVVYFDGKKYYRYPKFDPVFEHPYPVGNMESIYGEDIKEYLFKKLIVNNKIQANLIEEMEIKKYEHEAEDEDDRGEEEIQFFLIPKDELFVVDLNCQRECSVIFETEEDAEFFEFEMLEKHYNSIECKDVFELCFGTKKEAQWCIDEYLND